MSTINITGDNIMAIRVVTVYTRPSNDIEWDPASTRIQAVADKLAELQANGKLQFNQTQTDTTWTVEMIYADHETFWAMQSARYGDSNNASLEASIFQYRLDMGITNSTQMDYNYTA
jgi:hypothetical protein